MAPPTFQLLQVSHHVMPYKIFTIKVGPPNFESHRGPDFRNNLLHEIVENNTCCRVRAQEYHHNNINILNKNKITCFLRHFKQLSGLIFSSLSINQIKMNLNFGNHYLLIELKNIQSPLLSLLFSMVTFPCIFAYCHQITFQTAFSFVLQEEGVPPTLQVMSSNATTW